MLMLALVCNESVTDASTGRGGEPWCAVCYLSSRTEDKSGWETDVTAEQSAGGAALRRPGYRRRRRRFHSSLAQVVRPEIFFIPSTAPTPEA